MRELAAAAAIVVCAFLVLLFAVARSRPVIREGQIIRELTPLYRDGDPDIQQVMELVAEAMRDQNGNLVGMEPKIQSGKMMIRTTAENHANWVFNSLR